MTTQATIDKLREMKMAAMAENYRFQLEDPKFQELPFDDRFSLLVDLEYTSRKNARLKRLIHNAELDQPQASIADINYECGRKLDRNLILKLASCEYIRDNLNVFITGATGCGKTYLACALGMEACKQFYTTRYVRLPDLLFEMGLARSSNSTKRALQQYLHPKLLILDEWLLVKCPPEAQYDLMELIHYRTKSSSTIFCSQFHVEGWYNQLGGASPLADAIMDRIVHSAYQINIEAIDQTKDISMREVYGLKQR